MKTYQIKDLLKKDLLIIEWQDDYEIVGKIIFGKSEQKSVLVNLFNLDGYTLLGKPDEIREEDARELVENKGSYYKNYSPIHGSVQGNITFTATESLLSAIESRIYWDVNPYDEYKSSMTFANEYKNKWEKAELRTFNRNRSIILVKN